MPPGSLRRDPGTVPRPGSSAANKPESRAAPTSCRWRQSSGKSLVIDMSSPLPSRFGNPINRITRSMAAIGDSIAAKRRPASPAEPNPAPQRTSTPGDRFTKGCRSFVAAKSGRDGPAGKAVGLRCSPSAVSYGGGGRRPLDAHRVIVALSWHAPSCWASGPLKHTESSSLLVQSDQAALSTCLDARQGAREATPWSRSAITPRNVLRPASWRSGWPAPGAHGRHRADHEDRRLRLPVHRHGDQRLILTSKTLGKALLSANRPAPCSARVATSLGKSAGSLRERLCDRLPYKQSGRLVTHLGVVT